MSNLISYEDLHSASTRKAANYMPRVIAPMMQTINRTGHAVAVRGTIETTKRAIVTKTAIIAVTDQCGPLMHGIYDYLTNVGNILREDNTTSLFVKVYLNEIAVNPIWAKGSYAGYELVVITDKKDNAIHILVDKISTVIATL